MVALLMQHRFECSEGFDSSKGDMLDKWFVQRLYGDHLNKFSVTILRLLLWRPFAAPASSQLASIKADSYFARARARARPRPHIDDYGIFQINLILISPANLCRVHVPQSELCIIAEYIAIVYKLCIAKQLVIIFAKSCISRQLMENFIIY